MVKDLQGEDGEGAETEKIFSGMAASHTGVADHEPVNGFWLSRLTSHLHAKHPTFSKPYITLPYLIHVTPDKILLTASLCFSARRIWKDKYNPK